MLEEAIVGTLLETSRKPLENLSELGFHLSRSSLNLLAEKEAWEFRSKEGVSLCRDGIGF